VPQQESVKKQSNVRLNQEGEPNEIVKKRTTPTTTTATTTTTSPQAQSKKQKVKHPTPESSEPIIKSIVTTKPVGSSTIPDPDPKKTKSQPLATNKPQSKQPATIKNIMASLLPSMSKPKKKNV